MLCCITGAQLGLMRPLGPPDVGNKGMQLSVETKEFLAPEMKISARKKRLPHAFQVVEASG